VQKLLFSQKQRSGYTIDQERATNVGNFLLFLVGLELFVNKRKFSVISEPAKYTKTID
jgi:hypothetical protein